MLILLMLPDVTSVTCTVSVVKGTCSSGSAELVSNGAECCIQYRVNFKIVLKLCMLYVHNMSNN